jgi:hypothetical protein
MVCRRANSINDGILRNTGGCSWHFQFKEIEIIKTAIYLSQTSSLSFIESYFKGPESNFFFLMLLLFVYCVSHKNYSTIHINYHKTINIVTAM